MRNGECGILNTEYGILNTEYGIWNMAKAEGREAALKRALGVFISINPPPEGGGKEEPAEAG